MFQQSSITPSNSTLHGGKAGGQHEGHTSHPCSQTPSRWLLPLPASTYLGMWASLVVGVHQSK